MWQAHVAEVYVMSQDKKNWLFDDKEKPVWLHLAELKFKAKTKKETLSHYQVFRTTCIFAYTF